jgi:hypothetical protein
MNWKIHLNLSLLAVCTCFLLGLWFGYVVADRSPIVMFLTGAALGIAMRFGFRAVFLARCEACGHGAARQVGSRPIAYECGDCGQRRDTNYYEGAHRL